MAGFWTSETMKVRLPDLIRPYHDEQVKNCSYELSLGEQVFVTGEDKVKRRIEPGTQIIIPPGQFANLLTDETVSVPDDALGLISMKFTLKQPGLVNVSGFHVDPGYTGKLLFSVFNAGPQSVPITRGTATFLLWYCSLDQTTEDVYRKPPRTDITDSDVKHLGGDVASPQALAHRVADLEKDVRIGKFIVGAFVAAAIGLFVQQAVSNDGGTRSSSSSTTLTTMASTSSGPGSTTSSTRP